MSIRHLDHLLRPASIAVIGASNRPGSVGATVWRNLRAGRFTGPILAVNPKHASLDGAPVHASVSRLPFAPDLAVLCTPPATVPSLIDALARRGTRAAVVMTGGLSAGQKRAMLEAARPGVLRLLGPNCLGLLVPSIGLNASFAQADATAGEIAFVSQSGGLVTAVLDWAASRGIGFSQMISLGEHADVDVGDLLDYLANDVHTRSILLYIESIDAPRKFMSAARAAARNKPTIVVKAGRAGSGMQAAASHTGALAGSDIVFDAAIRRAGMLRADTLQELFSAAETLARFAGHGDESLTLMTNGGGAGVIAADAAALAGVPLQPLSAGVRARLDAILPANWSRANPIDIIGDAPASRYVETLQALLAERDSGTVLFMHAPTAIVRSDDIACACMPALREAPKRVMSCWLGDASVARARRLFEEAGVPDYATPEEAVRAFAMLATHRRNQALLLEVPAATETASPDTALARRTIAAALAAGREMLGESEARALLRAYGIPVVETLDVPPEPEAAAAAADRLGYPVALKIRSPAISHKSDLGGVALDLRDAAAVRQAAGEMLARVGRARPDARLEGYTLQPMVTRPMAQELILGASIDPLFGPVLLFGQGGTAVEVLADRAVALPPLNRVLAREQVARTRVSKLLAGYRDHPAADLDAVCDALIALSQMLADLPELVELDVNPLLADAQGVIALDARVRIGQERRAGAASFAIAPYPAQLAEAIDWQQRRLVLRPIRPEDEPAHRAFVERLSPNDMRLRFFNARRELPRSEFARLTQIDYDREMAFIAECRDDDPEAHTLGVVRAVADPDNQDAEFAIVVRSDLKQRGLGQLLLAKMIGYLRQRGTRRMVGYVLRENESMLRLAKANGMTVDSAGSDGEAVHMVLDLAPAPPPAG